MSRQNNGHRVSESEGMVWDSISQKPNLNITRAVRILTLSSHINQLFPPTRWSNTCTRRTTWSTWTAVTARHMLVTAIHRSRSCTFYQNKKTKQTLYIITFIGGGQRPTADGEVDHSTGVHIREPEEICQGDTSLKHPMVNFVPQSLVTSLPESLSVCFFTTSGPEANDLAMRLVKRYTGESDIMVVEEAHHGNIGIMLDISPKMHPK